MKKGLGARATKHYVTAAAKKAAAAAAANSHSVFEDALETEPTPEMQAAKKMQLEHKVSVCMLLSLILIFTLVSRQRQLNLSSIIGTRSESSTG